MKIASFLFLLSGLVVGARAASPSDFPIIVDYDFLNDGNIEVQGRLFQPTQATASPTQKFPLVIFLHGSLEAGTDNLLQINMNIDNLLAGGKSNGFYIFAPQSTNTNFNSWDDLWRLNDVMLMAGRLVRDYNIDPNRIIITGLSDGGGGTWLTISNFPDMLAAAIPICGDDNDTGWALVEKPIWAFHAQNDASINVSSSRNNINSIRVADPLLGTIQFFPMTDPSALTFYSSYAGTGLPEDGATFYDVDNLQYSEYTSGNHSIWPYVYGEATLYPWLMMQSQTYGSTPITPPAATEKILFDFGPTITGKISGQYWNSPGGTNSQALPLSGVGTGTGTERTLAPAVVFAYTNTGHRTPVILSVTQTFNGVSTGTSSSTLYPASVTQEGWEQGGTVSNANSIANPAELELSGLTPSALYQLNIYGSDTSANNNCATRYTVDNSTTINTDLTTRSNVNSFVTIDHVAADANGNLEIEIAPSPSTKANTFYSNISALAVSPISAVTYATWEANHFGSDTINGASTATPQHDGVNNLLKYFCNIDPTKSICAADRAVLPRPSLTTVGGVQYVALTYRQSATLSGLTVQMQTSTDLKTWQNVTPTVLSTSAVPLTQDSLITSGVPTGGAPFLYIRLAFTGA